MVKSLYNVANMFAKNLSKKADFFSKLRTEDNYKPDEFEEDTAIENDDEDEDDIDLMLKTDDDEDITGTSNKIPTFDDFAPDEKPEHINVDDAAYDREKRNYENYEKDDADKFERDDAIRRKENPKIWALFDRLQKENEENRANKKKASIINVANLYIKAAREDTKGAYFEDNADVPAEEESRPMRELLNETEEFPTEEEDVGLDINSDDDDDDNDDDNFGDPGEIAPLTEEQAEALRQERLALIKERHQAWKANKDAPPPSTDEDESLLETELENFDAEELESEEEEEDDEDEDFEDEKLELPEI